MERTLAYLIALRAILIVDEEVEELRNHFHIHPRSGEGFSLADVVFKHGLASLRSLSDRAISHVLLNILNRVQDLQ